MGSPHVNLTNKQLLMSIRSGDFGATPATRRLGGVTIYAPDEREMTRAFGTVVEAINFCSKPHLSLMRVALNSQVRDHLNITIDRRIFGAILASQLRLGIMDSIPCAAITGRVFRIYIHTEQLDTFQRHLATTVDELRLRRVIHVTDLEEKLFGDRRWGTWSSAFHILTRLVQIGRARYVTENSFCWPLEIEHAINKHLRRVRVVRASRLANNQEPVN